MNLNKKHNPIHVDGSQTSAFARIKDALPVVNSTEAPKVVVIGGGTGAPVSIRTLLSMGVEVSVVVAMADNGGSTGILREEANLTPPGDIRKCLAALASDPDDPMVQAFKYRFSFANEHTLGNLMLSALEYATGSFAEAIKRCGEILKVKGEVHPSTLDNIHLCGRTYEGKIIEGEARISHSRCALESVWLMQPPVAVPYPPAIKAICEADFIVLGPGSLFTSIIPNLLVPGVLDAIRSSKARTIFVCGLADMQGETWGFSAEQHVETLLRHGMAGMLDYVLVHSEEPVLPSFHHESQQFVRPISPVELDSDDHDDEPHVRPVYIDHAAVERIQKLGPKVIIRNLADKDRPTWHSPEALRSVFTEVLRYCHSPQM